MRALEKMEEICGCCWSMVAGGEGFDHRLMDWWSRKGKERIELEEEDEEEFGWWRRAGVTFGKWSATNKHTGRKKIIKVMAF
jgi:hypothetical protein